MDEKAPHPWTAQISDPAEGYIGVYVVDRDGSRVFEMDSRFVGYSPETNQKARLFAQSIADAFNQEA